MGLFSKRKNEPPRTEIPPEILEAVNVNGEKKIQASPATVIPGRVEKTQEPVSSGTSPFLKSKPDPTPVVSNQAPAPQNTPFAEASVATESPKPFQFSDQAPIPGEIHFTDTPAPQEAKLEPLQERPDFSQITQDKALLERHKEHLQPLKASPFPVEKGKKQFSSSSNILSGVVFLLILVFISGGSWYYLNTRSTQEKPSDMSIGQLEPGPEPANAQPKEGALLIDQPNYLVLDVETATLEQIQAMLQKEAEKMSSQGITTPIEYLVVDTNNNPVAFSRFAIFIGADNPKDLVEASLEPFSLYLVLDNAALRMALAIPLKAEIGANFPENKAILAESLKKFFYPEPQKSSSLQNVTFNQSSYKNNVIFYTNIDEAGNISFDVTSQEGILTVANSKNALRAVIDKRALPVSE